MNSTSLLAGTFHVGGLIRGFLLIIIGYIIARSVSKTVADLFGKKLTPHQLLLLRLSFFYVIFTLFLVSAIQELGFSIGALLGATGILTIAITFASQTTLSNMISGFFIIGEKAFQIGDTIKVNDIQGEVLSINFFSIKIRTPEHTLIRIPNELLIKSPITNISYFPLRRVDLMFSVNYQTNLNELKKKLIELAHENQFTAAHPAPYFSILNFNENAISVQLSFWTDKKNYQEAKNLFYLQIPQQIIYNKTPLEIKMINQEEPSHDD